MIKHKKENLLSHYFSLRCGLVCKLKPYEKLSEEELNILTAFKEAILEQQEETITAIKNSGMYELSKLEKIEKIAKYECGIDKEKINDGSYRVCKTFPAIELKEFAKNTNYKFNLPFEQNMYMGAYVFWGIIAPKIISISKIIGAKYVYLFAAASSDSNLIKYYRNVLKFSDSEYTVFKPDYDEYCYTLIQEISKLQDNKNTIINECSND
ncbi:MAG: hypothetical protein ACTTIX_03900 [Peptoanaerobacter stomatis]